MLRLPIPAEAAGRPTRPRPRLVVALAIALAMVILLASAGWRLFGAAASPTGSTMALLVPDDYRDASVAVWKQAASEEGVLLEVVSASSFLSSSAAEQASYAGVILPDSIHRRANNALTDSLRRYTEAGGRLMVVFDAVTLDLNGTYPSGGSRMAPLTGVAYADFDRRGQDVITQAGIVGSRENFRKLGFTPGRYAPETPAATAAAGTTPSPAAAPAPALAETRSGATAEVFDQWLTTYQYPLLRYPVFRTGAVGPGVQVWLKSATGDIVASESAAGHGRVLFVNLPLGYLKGNTDGLPLHAFLRHFSDEVAVLPRLLAAPDGIGGLILNIHVDNGAAIHSLDKLQALGVFTQGPYSVHFTAGPDVDRPGDGRGMNLTNNPAAQDWVRRLRDTGHAIGNHGGWIHNYFGSRVREDNRAAFVDFLKFNDDAVRAVLGRPVTEYSAPIGNQPLWVTDWLAAHGVLTYYTTSNLGMGPTRMFQGGRQIDVATWSMPITPFGRIASFEEAMFAKQPEPPLAAWLQELVSFVADSRSIREIYCHPIGVPYYAGAMQALLDATRASAADGRFAWRTMTQVAQFMSRREAVAWHADVRGGQFLLEASHPVSLAGMAWQLPLARCAQPTVLHGAADVRRDGAVWRVVAGSGTSLALTCARSADAATVKPGATRARAPG